MSVENNSNSQSPANRLPSDVAQAINDVLREFPQILLAVVFGSAATGRLRPGSDLDLAVATGSALSAPEKIALIGALAERTGRPIDLIDLHTTTEPLLGQIVKHGKRIMGSDTLFGNLISRHLFEEADFMPYRRRLLAERRNAWIGS